MMIKYCLTTFLVCLLAGCASKSVAPSHHYLLPYPGDVVAIADRAPVYDKVRLKAIALPSFLQKQNMVLVDNQGQVFQASNHFWAESLERQLEGITLTYLADRLPRVTWLSPAQYQVPASYLTIQLEQFYADPDGAAVIAGYWTLWSPDNVMRTQHRFRYTGMMTEDGYLAMAHTLAQIWFHDVLDHLVDSVLVR